MPDAFACGIVLVQAVAVGNKRVAIGQTLCLTGVAETIEVPDFVTIPIVFHHASLIHFTNEDVACRQSLRGERIAHSL